MMLKSHSNSWLVTNTTLCHPLRGCPKWDNSRPSHLICMTHVRHGGSKWVTHRFCYTTYIFKRQCNGFVKPYHCFNRTMHRKNMDIAYRSRLHMKIRTLHIKNVVSHGLTTLVSNCTNVTSFVASHGLTTLVSNYTNATSIASGMLPIFRVVSHQHHQ
jgi:hypothetical protein